MNFLLGLAALLAAEAPNGVGDQVRIDIGRADWAQVPALDPRPPSVSLSVTAPHIERLLRERECRMQGQTARHFDIDVPWMIEIQPDGRLTRIVVADVGCRALEEYVGDIILQLARQGEINAEPAMEARWYRSDFNFNQTS
jgi:hypothetical protein